MNYSKKCALAAVLTVIASAAHAQLTQVQNFSFTPNGTVNLVFNQVDLDVADITSIEVTVQMNKSGGSLSVDNDSAESGEVSFEHTLDGALSSSDVSLADSNGQTNWASTELEAVSSTVQTLGGTTGDATNEFNNTGDVDFFAFNPADTSDTSSAFINSAFFSGYTGTGTYTLTFDANQLVSAIGLGGLQQALTVSQTDGFVEVKVVPEPSAYALIFGIVAIVIGVVRRRR